METVSRWRRGWRIGRRIFRWCRICILLLVLLVLCGGLYLNRVGLPGFLRQPLLNALRARGVDFQYAKLRLSWHRGFVAEDVHFGRSDQDEGPTLTATSVDLYPDFPALKRFDLAVSRLVIRRGFLAWPLPLTNAPLKTLAVDDIQLDLRLVSEDTWRLDRGEARMAGTKLVLGGTIRHASALRTWKFFTPDPAAPAGLLETRLRGLVDAYEQMRFSSPPELKLDLFGDALEPESFTGLLTLSAPGAQTPWGNLTNAVLTARLTPPSSPHALPLARLTLRATSAQTRWARTRDLQLTAHSASLEGQTNIVEAVVELRAGDISTDYVSASSMSLKAHWTHSLTNPIPHDGECDLELARAKTRWGNSASARLRVQLQPAGPDTPPADPAWMWWTNLEPYRIEAQLDANRVDSPQLRAANIAVAARWQAPELTITNFTLKLPSGEMRAPATLNVATRQLALDCESNLDPLQLAPALPRVAQDWLSQFTFEHSPQVTGRVAVRLPAWDDAAPDWIRDIRPTLRITGQVQAAGGSYRGLQVTSAEVQFNYSNQCWHLPELRLTRPEGAAQLIHLANDVTRDIYWRIHSDIFPSALKPLLSQAAGETLDLYQSAEPPLIEGEVWANGAEAAPRGFVGSIVASNFAFRGVPCVSLTTAVNFTNRVIEFIGPQAVRADGLARVERVVVDLDAETIFLTNGFSSTAPTAVLDAIGPDIARNLEPYQFDAPPEAQVNGLIPMHGEAGADLRVEFNGGPFRWWRFQLPHVLATVQWTGDRADIELTRGEFYDGRIHGKASFDLASKPGTDFNYELYFDDLSLDPFLRDISERTNNVEGRVTGQLHVLSANTDDWESWQGRGEATLRDGLIWEFPFFGVFSPILNGISPGLGNTRFSDGNMTCGITNSVISFRNLELNSPLLRMRLRGTVDFHEQVNAKVEADLLRNTWLIGPVISTALWPLTKAFEYKVTGTLTKPDAEPLHIPKALLAPLSPVQWLKDIFAPDSGRNNPPPVFQPVEEY